VTSNISCEAFISVSQVTSNISCEPFISVIALSVSVLLATSTIYQMKDELTRKHEVKPNTPRVNEPDLL